MLSDKMLKIAKSEMKIQKILGSRFIVETYPISLMQLEVVEDEHSFTSFTSQQNEEIF